MKTTRPYVPGRSLWGALTCRLARDRFSGDYVKASELVNDRVRFSYLFASDSPEGVELWPWGGSLAEFSWRFLHSYASTALTDAKSKLDGSLHETELVAPYSRRGRHPVWLHGYYWVRQDGTSVPDLAAIVRGVWPAIQLGGERNYGWGRFAEWRIEPAGDDEALFGVWEWSAHEDRVSVKSANEAFAPAHVVTDDETDAVGSFDVLVGRTTDMNSKSGQFGRTLTEAEICWAPGTVFGAGHKFRVGSYGLWSATGEIGGQAAPTG